MKFRWLPMVPLLALLVSCGPKNPLEKTYTLPTQNAASSAPAQAPAPAVAIPVSREKPAEELLTKEIDIHALAETYFIRCLRGEDVVLADIAADIGIECLRKTGTGSLYSVHQVKQGGNLYMFYTNFPDFPDYHGVVQWFYVQKRLTYQDFSRIQEGSTIDDVEKADPVTQIFENLYHADTAYWDALGGFQSWHYLRDGILKFTYKSKDGKLTVTEKNFRDDFKIVRVTSRDEEFDGRILEMDWLH